MCLPFERISSAESQGLFAWLREDCISAKGKFSAVSLTSKFNAAACRGEAKHLITRTEAAKYNEEYQRRVNFNAAAQENERHDQHIKSLYKNCGTLPEAMDSVGSRKRPAPYDPQDVPTIAELNGGGHKDKKPKTKIKTCTVCGKPSSGEYKLNGYTVTHTNLGYCPFADKWSKRSKYAKSAKIKVDPVFEAEQRRQAGTLIDRNGDVFNIHSDVPMDSSE